MKNIFACRQAKVACSMFACHLRNWQTKVTKLQILMSDKQCWPVSPGLKQMLMQPLQHHFSRPLRHDFVYKAKMLRLYGNDTNDNDVKDSIFGFLKRCSEKN